MSMIPLRTEELLEWAVGGDLPDEVLWATGEDSTFASDEMLVAQVIRLERIKDAAEAKLKAMKALALERMKEDGTIPTAGPYKIARVSFDRGSFDYKKALKDGRITQGLIDEYTRNATIEYVKVVRDGE